MVPVSDPGVGEGETDQPGTGRQRPHTEHIPDVGLEDPAVAVQLVVPQPGGENVCRLQAGAGVVSDNLR